MYQVSYLLNDRLSVELYNGGVQKGTKYSVDNILSFHPGEDPYGNKFHCSKHGKNFNLLLKSEVLITITHLVVFQAPSYLFTSPITSGALHVYSDRPSWEELDNWTDLKKEETEGDSPHLFFKLQVDEPYLVVSLKNHLFGKYVHVKFISAVGNNIDIGRIGFLGFASEEEPNHRRLSLKSILFPPSVWKGKITHDLWKGSKKLVCLFGGCDNVVKKIQWTALKNSFLFTQSDILFVHCTPHDPLSEEVRRELGVWWNCLVYIVKSPFTVIYDYRCVEPDAPLSAILDFLNGMPKDIVFPKRFGVVPVTKNNCHVLVTSTKRDFLVGVHPPEFGVPKTERISSKLHFLAKQLPQIAFGDFDLEHSRLDPTLFPEPTLPIFKFFPYQKAAVTYSGPFTLDGILNFLCTHATVTVDWDKVKLNSARLSDVLDLNVKSSGFLYPPAAQKPQTIEEAYEIIQVLGKGGFATVVKARNKATGDLVALKIIPKKDKDKNELQRLKDEIDFLQKLSHPNIIKLLDVYENNIEIYLVLELATGGDLLAQIRITGVSLPEQETVNIIKQVLLAIKYMHSKGVVHRDLKLENLLFSGSSKIVKVADFGISKDFKQNLQTSRVGTLPYMAPEIFSGAAYDNKVDIWSLGVVTYTLLCGENPFKGEIEQICKVSYDFPIYSHLSANAKIFIRSILVKDPNQRPSAAKCLKSLWITSLADHFDWESESEEEEEEKSLTSHLPQEMVARVNKRILNCVMEKVIPEIKNNSATLLSDAYWGWGLKCNVDTTAPFLELNSILMYFRFCIDILLKEVEKILSSEIQQFILSDQSFHFSPDTFLLQADKVDPPKPLPPLTLLTILGYFTASALGVGLPCGFLGFFAIGVTAQVVASKILTPEPHNAIESLAVSCVLKALESPTTHQIILKNIELILHNINYSDDMLEKQKAILSSSQVNFGVTTTFDTWRVISVKVDENSLQSEAVFFNILVLDGGGVKLTSHRFSQCRQMYLNLCSQFPDKVNVMNAFPQRTIWVCKDMTFLLKRSQGLLNWLKQCEEDYVLSKAMDLKTFLGMGATNPT